jgi:hypothetical protein
MTTNGKLRVAGLLCAVLALVLDFYTDARYRFLLDSLPLGTYSILRATLPHNAAEWHGILTQLGWLGLPLLASNGISWKARWPAVLSLATALFFLWLVGHDAWDSALITTTQDDADFEWGPSLDTWLFQLVCVWVPSLPLVAGKTLAWFVHKLPSTPAPIANR